MRKSILIEGKAYTFSDFFELSKPTKEIVAEFGYDFQLKKLELPHAPFEGSLERLRNTFYEKLPYISLNSETAKREVFVAPILLELLDYVEVNIDIEYPLNLSDRLKESIDYLIRGPRNLVIVEAKKADLERGFSQLSVELIAIDEYIEDDNNVIYGAVTIGDLWRFGTLARKEKLISKDIDSFRVPLDLEELFSILIGILKARRA